MVNVVQVFRNDGNGASFDSSRPIGLENYQACPHDSPDLLDRQVGIFNRLENVLFLITRSKNTNTVVYQYSDGPDPIVVFWQRFADFAEQVTDPNVLREDLSWIQRNMAYGVSVKSLADPPTSTITLVACPQFPMKLVKDHFNMPRLQLKLDGRECYLLRIFVEARENLIGYPTVIFTNIHAIDLSNGQEVVVKIKP
jgi:Domain of unknown function (DUF4833)